MKEAVKIALISIVLPFTCSCPGEFPVGYQSSCFHFSSALLTWQDAKVDCNKHGGKLAEPKNAQVSNFLSTYAKGLGKEYYIGGSDNTAEGKWVWASDNSPINFTDWARREPSGGHSHNCLQLWRNGDYKWDDYDCTSARSHICEKSLPVVTCPTTTTTTTTSSSTPIRTTPTTTSELPTTQSDATDSSDMYDHEDWIYSKLPWIAVGFAAGVILAGIVASIFACIKCKKANQAEQPGGGSYEISATVEADQSKDVVYRPSRHYSEIHSDCSARPESNLYEIADPAEEEEL